MFAPIRALVSLRPGSAVVLVVGAVSVSLLFAATPFLIPLVAVRYDVAVGTSGLISTAQVAGFAVTTFVAGRWWRPTRSKFVVAALLGVLFNAASAVSTDFELLLALRVVTGAAAGVFTWLAWADAMRDQTAMRRVSAVGPVSVLVGAPLLAWIGSVWGAQGLYWALAGVSLPVVSMRPRFAPMERRGRRRMSPSRSNVVLLGALGLLTMAGSSLFVFAAALATDEIGMGAVAVAVGFSANAAAGLAGAWWRRRPQLAWPWLLAVAVSAAMLVAVQTEVTYYLGMLGWGFAFWMAVPRVLTSIAEWSLVPEERVGDAQSLMAAGRSVGPAVGAVLVGAGSFARLGWFSGTGLVAAGVLVGVVELYRRDREGPRDAVSSSPGAPEPS